MKANKHKSYRICTTSDFEVLWAIHLAHKYGDGLPDILLIVPCFNEQNRLNISEFEKRRADIDFAFCDDGSSDDTGRLLESYSFEVFSNPKNMGKGNSIQRTYSLLSRQRKLDDYRWIGYWDADLAIPLDFLDEMIELGIRTKADAVWASRSGRLSYGSPPYVLRSAAGLALSLLVRCIFKTKIRDTQCGAKVFSNACAQAGLNAPFLSRWLFDIEIMKRLEGRFRICEWRMPNPRENSGSRLKIRTELLISIKDLFSIFRTYGR